MANLVWLASYPKSGNTWVRAFLTAYLAGPGIEIDINDLDASMHAASRSLFDRVIGLPSADLLDHEIEALRADVYRAFDAEADGPLFLKTHDAWHLTPAGDPVFPAEATKLVVTIVRNPLAIAPSYAHHYACTIDQAIEQMADPSLVIAQQGRRLASQLPQHLGTWSEHTASWLDQDELPVLTVRYEDLRVDPEGEFSRILRACGFEVEAGLVRDALDRSSFERLQRAEAMGGFKERLSASPSFFRRGEANGWRQELTDHQARRVIDQHEPMMSRLGYHLDRPSTANDAGASVRLPGPGGQS